MEGFGVLKGLADALVERQGLLSNNLANIGNKDYQKKDIDFNRVLSELKSDVPSMESNNKGLISRATYTEGSKPTLESEMSNLYENHLRYTLLVKGIGHHFEHMKKALEVRAS